MILNAAEIRGRDGMITPFVDTQGRDGYGLSSFGYNARASREWKVCISPEDWQTTLIIDPKKFNAGIFREIEHDFCIIPPHGFALGRTIERFKIPRDVLGICMGKSTCGIVVGCAPLEPEWEGTATLEFSNTTALPVKIYAGEGVCQFLFLRGGVSYADRSVKYMNQTEVTL